MNLPTPKERIASALAHIDDPGSIDALCQSLTAIHGDSYRFSLSRWNGQTNLSAPHGRQRYCMIMETGGAQIHLSPGQRVRGIPPSGPYLRIEEHWAAATAPVTEELWPGDILCVDNAQCRAITLSGTGLAFVIEAEATAYPVPTVAFLRYLTDRPGGCAAYPGAFRREQLPPVRATASARDQRGVNRINVHTLDMRSDREPKPQPHHHGPVATRAGGVVNHSEIALVLSRSSYALPPLHGSPATPESGSILLYPDPIAGPTVCERISVRPGSILVTPATTERIAGHCFENAFAMLVAIPGFVSPHQNIHP